VSVHVVGFVGIGSMGWPMASRLVQAGFDVIVHDAQAGRAESFAREVGGRAAPDATAAVHGCDALITMLPTSEHVCQVVRAVGTSWRPGSVVVEMSSGVPATTQAMAAELADHDVALVDCPVSGGVARAETGSLAILAGGSVDVVERVRPLLDAMGDSVHHCGAVGAGQAMKALNNLMSAAGFLVGVEALLVGRRFGLAPDRMVDVLNASSGMNNSTQRTFAKFVLSRTFDSGFGLDLMAKDLGIAADIARQAGVVTPFSALCAQLWTSAANVLGPGCDHTEMARFSEVLAGFEVS
jgi:3-hydroxyisobutyrate dehydrogenase